MIVDDTRDLLDVGYVTTMSRPEHVKCINCCYWERLDEATERGHCRYLAPVRMGIAAKLGVYPVAPSHWFCGKFDETWPSTAKEEQRVLRCARCGMDFSEGELHTCPEAPDGC